MKKTFRINLFKGCNSLCETLAILAAKSNGSDVKLSLDQLKSVADGKIIEFPASNEGVTVELIGEHLLHIDRNMDDEWKTICSIEEIEVFSISTPIIEAS